MVNRKGHSLVELIVATTVLGVGLASVGAASVFATRRTREALLKERAVVLAVATLDSLTLLSAPTAGSLHRPPFRVAWAVDAGPGGGVIRLSVSPVQSPRWVQRFQARFLSPVPALPE